MGRQQRVDDDAQVVVVGAGVVGLSIAWRIAATGRRVVLCDPAPAQGATFAAAGMLAPVSEFHFQEDGLLPLLLASAARYPSFLQELAAAEAGAGPGGDPAESADPGLPAVPVTGTDAAREAGYAATPTLLVGVDTADRRALDDLHAAHLARGLSAERLALGEARALAPLLGPRVTCGYLIRGDHSVDPRRLAGRLLLALERARKVRIVREQVTGLVRGTGRGADPGAATAPAHAESSEQAPVTGVRLADGSVLSCAEVVLANAIGAAALDGLPDGLHLPLRPVFGDILRLRVPQRLRTLLPSTVRAVVRGESVYLVPRRDGTIVLGATQREDGLEGVSAAGVHRLLRDAQEVLPAVAEFELLESTARPRPATPDNAPLLGRVGDGQGADLPGLIVATGFFRHGVLLAPLAADICAGLLDGRTDPRAAPFRADRFCTERFRSDSAADRRTPRTAPTPTTVERTFA
ncbi:MAG: FAD-dependent oxidoreductase [Actinobacteria bacterium]|nr:FAD-dependent oxidoreductase [Actinomycetota bacterium]